MVESASIENHFHKTPNIYPNILNDQECRLKKINEIKRTNEEKS